MILSDGTFMQYSVSYFHYIIIHFYNIFDVIFLVSSCWLLVLHFSQGRLNHTPNFIFLAIKLKWALITWLVDMNNTITLTEPLLSDIIIQPEVCELHTASLNVTRSTNSSTPNNLQTAATWPLSSIQQTKRQADGPNLSAGGQPSYHTLL